MNTDSMGWLGYKRRRSGSGAGLLFALAVCGGHRAPAQTAAPSDEPSTISGQVVDGTTGLPVPRALVQMNGAAQLTGGEGKFTLALPSSGTGYVTATKPGYYESPANMGAMPVQVPAAQADRPVTLRLFREAIIAGKVNSTTGEPLPGIQVEARMVNFGNGASQRLLIAGVARTDSHGQFRIPVPAGDFQVETMYNPSSPETGLAVLPAAFPAGAAGSGTFHLGNGETQSVRLRAATGPAYTARVRVEGLVVGQVPLFRVHFPDGTTASLANRYSRETGEATLRLPAGSYQLEIMTTGAGRRMFGSMQLDQPSHDVVGLSVSLTPVPAIPVHLRVEHAARQETDSNVQSVDPKPQQLGLTLQPAETEENRGAAALRPGPDGTMVFEPISGVYQLMAGQNRNWYIRSAAYGSTSILGRSFTIAAGAGAETLEIVVSDDAGSLTGTSKVAGTPGRSFVVLVPMFPSATPRVLLRSDNGSFSASALAPGSYHAVAFEFWPSQDLTDPAVLRDLGTAVQTVTITAGEQATLDLQAVPGDGRPK